MIGVKGQYVFIFSLEGKKDFIEPTDLIEFKLIEEAGNVLPTFSLEFLTRDDTLPDRLNEGNVLNVSFGKDLNDIEETSLTIQKVIDTKQGNEKIKIIVTGTLNKLAYHKTNVVITPKQSGFKSIEQIVGKHFKFDSNVTLTNDENKMYWIQSGISDKKFINDIWLHTYLPNSFIGVAITADNRFILRDIKKKFKNSEPDWKLSNTSATDKDIFYDGDYSRESRAGFINAWVGYRRVKGVYDLVDGEFENFSHDVKPLIALTNKLIRNADIESKNAELGYISDNVHKNYWLAFLVNLSNLAVFSTICLRTSFQNQFKKIKPLDSIYFKESSTNLKTSSESSSGLYIVTKIVRILTNNQYITCLECCRESNNQVKGNLK